MINRLFKSVKYICPLFAAAFPLIAIIGAIISPPAWVESALRKQDYHFKILISFSSMNRGSGDHQSQESSRSYILFPGFKTVEITRYSYIKLDPETNFQEKTVEKSEVTTKESTLLSYEALLSYFACLFGTWWYWMRPASRQVKKEST